MLTTFDFYCYTLQDCNSLRLSILREKLRLKSHVKCKGRPKQSSKLWPSKNKGKKTGSSASTGKENLQLNGKGSQHGNKRAANPEKEDPISPKAKRQRHQSHDVKRGRLYQPGTPAYRSRMKRERSRKKAKIARDACIREEELITIPYDVDEPTEEQICMVFSETNLLHSDIEILESSDKWLNDKLINAGQVLMKEKFGHVAGLQDVGRSNTLTFEDESEESNFIQILNCHGSHWICVTNMNCKPNVVKIYDSMRTGDVPTSTKEVIASLLHLPQSYIFLIFPDVQQQSGGSECGLYSLAFAYTLCSGKDPATIEYDQSLFRVHFLNCLKERTIASFRHCPRLYIPEEPLWRKFRVYCYCRLPDTGDSMVQCLNCHEWFHFTCVDHTEDCDTS